MPKLLTKRTIERVVTEAHLSSSVQKQKREQDAVCSIAEEFVCPISLDLPLEPVTAADGRVYNRASIQTHIDSAKEEGNILRSPVTNEPMADTLVPAIQVANTIRALIGSGLIEKDLASNWEIFEVIKKRAANGDVDAMCDLGTSMLSGEHGQMKNAKAAFFWYSKAAEKDSCRGMFAQGMMLSQTGSIRNKVTAAALLGVAAAQGHVYACLRLGQSYFSGLNGFRSNMKQAEQWLTKSLLESPLKPASEILKPTHKKLAQAYLKHIAEDDTSNPIHPLTVEDDWLKDM